MKKVVRGKFELTIKFKLFFITEKPVKLENVPKPRNGFSNNVDHCWLVDIVSKKTVFTGIIFQSAYSTKSLVAKWIKKIHDKMQRLYVRLENRYFGCSSNFG